MERNFLAVIFLLALALIGYFLPIAGIMPALAAFFLIPGAAVVWKLAGGKLSKLEFTVASIILSVLLSTHFIYWFSIIFGYSQESVTAATALLCLPALLIALPAKAPRNRTNSTHKQERKTILSKEVKIALAIAAMFFLFLTAMYHNNYWVEQQGRLLVGGWNWSDLFVHLPVALTINNGNFPPQMPFYAGEKLVYHYFADFHSAIVANYFGGSLSSVIEAMRWDNALLPPLFFLACFALARRVTKKGSTALIAATLIVFGGGFAYYNLFSQAAATNLSSEGILSLAQKNAFDNDSKFFQIPSLMGGYLLVQRPQMVGLPTLATVLLLLCAYREHKKRGLLLLAGITAGLLAPFHYFAFATAMAAIAVFLALEFYGKRKIDFPGAAAALAPALLSLPFAFEALSTTGRAGNVKLSLGWLAPKEPLEFAFFYLVNFGVPFLLAFAALKYSKFDYKKELAALGLFCFALPNILALSGTVWDMGKFFTYLWIPTGIFAASFLENKPKIIVAAALLLSVITPLQMMYWFSSSDWSVMGEDELEAGEWMRENTPQKSVFVTSTEHISPVDSVAGRLRVVGYAGWMNNFGLPYGEREAILPNAFCGSEKEKKQTFEALGATYLYSGPGERKAFQCDHSLGLRKLFSNAQAAVYSLE